MAMSIFVRLTFTAKLGNALPALASLLCECGDVRTMLWRWRGARRWVWTRAVLSSCRSGTVPVWIDALFFSYWFRGLHYKHGVKTKHTCYFTISMGQEAWCDLAAFSDRLCPGCVQRVSRVCNLICSPLGEDMLSLALSLKPSISCCPVSQKSPHLLEATLGGSRPHGPPNTGGLQQGSLLLESQQGSKRTQRPGC